MRFLYRLQQRLALTAVEGTVLCALAASLALGTAVRGFQDRDAEPAAELFAADARFAALDRAAARPAGAATADGVAADAPAADAPAVDSSGPTSSPAPTPSESASIAAGRPARTAEADPTPGSINLNTASAAELERLPRIGPALAARIVDDRDRLGPFRRIEDVERVRGIGPAIRARIAPFVRL